MKNIKLIFTLIILTQFSFIKLYSQNIEFDYNEQDKILSTLTKEIKKNEPYFIQINGINKAYLKVLISTEDKKLITPIPELIKPILPAVTYAGSAVGFTDNDTLPISKFEKNLDRTIKRINEFTLKTKSLYTFLKKSKDIAIQGPQKLQEIYNVYDLFLEEDSFEELKQEVLIDYHFIKICKDHISTEIKYPYDIEMVEIVKLKSYLTTISEQISLKNLSNYIIFLEHFQNHLSDDSTELVVAPYVSEKKITLKKDVLEANIKIVDVFTRDTLTTETFDLYAKNRGWHFNFSSGFIANNLVQNKYYLSPRDTLINSVVKEDTDGLDISIGALGHLNYSLSSYVSTGFSLGLGVSPFDGQTRYLLGGNLALGRKKQLVFNAGAILARLDELSASIKQDEQGLFLPNGKEITTFKKNEWGFFFALTYNLLQQRK